nr:copia protein [Tanacetum cinerariifolium]
MNFFHGKTLALRFLRPFGCPVTILNTKDHLNKFDGKADEGLFIGYSLHSKAFTIFNNKTRIVEANLHIRFSENIPNIAGSGPNWLFDIDALTKSMNYKPFVAGNQSNGNAGTKHLMMQVKLEWRQSKKKSECKDQEKEDNESNTNNVNAACKNRVNVVGANTNNELPFDPEMPDLEDISTFNFSSDHEDNDEEADMNNLDTTIQIEEKVYVCQPLGFEDPEFLKKVYKVKKALSGLYQAPRAWYETLSTYLLDNGFHRGKIDKTLFIRRHKDDTLLIQVYVDDIIFEFKNASTPMETQKPLLKDEDGEEMDVQMDGQLQVLVDGKKVIITESTIRRYLQLEDVEGVDCLPNTIIFEHLTLIEPLRIIFLRPDIMFAVCACVRYQVNPKVLHLHAVKRIFSLEELFTQQEKMELETRQTSTTAKLPILKKGDYEMWRLRIEKYFQVQDYAICDVIKSGNSFVPVTQTTLEGSDITTTISSLITAEEKIKKKNDVKARKSLKSIFNELQKIVSQLAVLGKFISQEDLNLKFLRSLPSEWNTHVVVWRNKPDLDTMSIDDLYKNFKIVKQEVKGNASSNSSSQNMAFVLPSEWNTHVVVWRNKPDLDTISIDDLYKNFKIVKQVVKGNASSNSSSQNMAFVSSSSTNKGLGTKIVETSIKIALEGLNVEETFPKAMVTIDGVGFNWSYMAEDKVLTNMALMDFSDSKGLASIEEQVVFYKNNETTLYENIAVLTRDMSIKDSEINVLKSELEKIKQEKEGIQLKIEKFKNASKSLDKLLGSQITDKSKNSLGFQSYNAVPLPATLVYNTGRCPPLKTDLSYSGIKEFKQPQFEIYGPKSCEKESKNASEDIPNELKEYHDAPLVKYRMLDNKYCSVESPVVVEKKTDVPTIAKVEVDRPKQQEKPVRKIVRPRSVNTARPNSAVVNAIRANQGHPQKVQEDQGYVDSGCSRHMTGNMSYLSDLKEFDEGYVTFGRGANGGRITGKGTLKTDKPVTTTSSDPLLSGEDRLKLTELMELCTQLQSRVLALENTKANQALEIGSIKRRVKKIKKKASKKTHKLKRLYKIGSSSRVESSEDGRNDQDMFDTSILDDEEVVAETEVSIADLVPTAGEVVTTVGVEVSTADLVPTAGEVVTTAGVEVSTASITSQIFMDEITLAKALIDIKTSKHKAKRIVIQEPNETHTPTPIDSSQQ